MSRSTLKDFDVISRLGAGSFGTVYKAKRIIDEKLYVMKVVRIGELSHRERSDAINEVQILAQLKSSFVVCYYDSFIEKDNLHIVMEFCNRGDLQNLLKKAKERNVSGLKEPIVWNMALQIILGLYYLHKKNILHRDLKSANVFLNKDASSANYHLKIGDLGVAKLMDTSTALARTIVGTPYYLSPELCKDMPYRDKSDCWALGVIIYECCTLEHPFEARNQCALIMKIIESPVKPPPPTNASPVLTNLILWLLQKDPRLRPSIRDLLKEVVVRHRLREEGLALPEEMLDAETTNYLEQGLPTQLPKDLEEKASVMEDDGTVGLMTTLVDDKDAAHRSFRIAAAALSAQSSSNQMGEAAPANAAAPPVQRGPSGRFAPPTAEGHAAPTAVKRTGSTTVSRTNSNVSVGAAAAAAAVATPTAAVGNRVRGVNRARGNIPSDKARTRYQRPPVPHPSTTSGGQVAQQQQPQSQPQPQQPQTSSGMLSPSPASFSETVDDMDPHQLPYGGGDEESSMQDGGEDYDDGDDLDVGGPVGAYEDDLADAKPVPLTHSRRPSERFSSKELDTSSSEPSPMMGDAKVSALSTPEAKKQRPDSKISSGNSLNSSANHHHQSNTEDEYESDFVPEEEDDHYDVNAAGKLGIGIGMGGARMAVVDAKADSKEPAMGTSMTSTTPAPLHSTSSNTSLYYNRSMMSTGMSAMHTLNGVGHGDDAELWNSIWTEKRGVVGGADSSPVGAGLDSHDDMDRFNIKGVTPEADAAADNAENAAESVPMVPIPTQEVTEMLDMARKKAIADLGETLFTKIYSLLSRHMKQDHGANPGEDTESAMNLRMLQELETLLSEELQVHGVALVSDAVFRVRALLAFESKCAALLTAPVTAPPLSARGKDKHDVDDGQETRGYRSDLPTVQEPWRHEEIRRK